MSEGERRTCTAGPRSRSARRVLAALCGLRRRRLPASGQRRRSHRSTSTPRHPGGRPPRPRRHLHARRTRRTGGRQNVTQPARGRLRQPERDHRPARRPTSPSTQCPRPPRPAWSRPRRTTKANPNFLLGTAPVFDMDAAGRRRDRAPRLHRADREHPDHHPDRVRTGTDYGLRMTVAGITPDDPARVRRPDGLGLPGRPTTTTDDASQRLAGRTGRLPGPCRRRLRTVHLRRSAAITCPRRSSTTRRPAPGRTAAGRASTSRPTRTRASSTTRKPRTRRRPAARNETFKPVLNVGLTIERGRLRRRDSTCSCKRRSSSASPTRRRRSARRAVDPAGRAHDQPGRRRRPDRLHRRAGQLRQRGARANAPTTRRSAPSTSRTPALDGAPHRLALLRRAEAGQPVPRLHGRRRLRHPRQARRRASTPTRATGQLTMRVRRPAPGSVRRVQPPPLRLRPRPGRDADALHDLRGRLALHPLERQARPPALAARSSASTRARTGASCPGEIRPFHPRLVAGTSNPVAGAFSAFHLKLDRDDGDQFLGDLNFRMPPGLHRLAARDRLLPGGGDRRGGQQLGPQRSRPTRAARPRSQIGTTNVAAGPGSTRSTRSGRCTWPARSRARR